MVGPAGVVFGARAPSGDGPSIIRATARRPPSGPFRADRPAIGLVARLSGGTLDNIVWRYIVRRYMTDVADIPGARSQPMSIPRAVGEFSRPGAAGLIVAGIAGLAWMWFELTPPRLGFDDTDSPGTMLAFLRAHPEVYAQAGVALLILAFGLVLGVLATGDRLRSPRRDDPSLDLATRFLGVVGIGAAACLFLMGVLRLGVQPLLHVEGLDPDWAASAYLVQQFAGVHGVGQGGILLLAAWAVGVGLVGVRRGAVPRVIAILALFPALRIVGIIGPFGLLPEQLEYLWVAFMAAIPGTMVWLIFLGLTLLRWRPTRSTA
jgi:hypothetical protein